MSKKLINMLHNIFDGIENNHIFFAIRKGLVMAVPILTIGSIALILISLPINAYQDFMKELWGGGVLTILFFIKDGTFDFISVLLLVTISYSYAQSNQKSHVDTIYVPIVAMASFIALSGIHKETFHIAAFGPTGLFVAMVTAILSSIYFIKLCSITKRYLHPYLDGTDISLSSSLQSIIPGFIVIGSFAFLNQIIYHIFGVTNLQELISNSVISLFNGMGRNLFSGLLFMFFIHLFWLFGIHGSNALDIVAQDIFSKGLDINIERIGQGLLPTEIFSKTFFDTFSLIGGCGATFCLVASILLFSKQNNIRSLAKIGLLPVLFNINELLVLGLPIVFNPILMIPFIFTPLITTCVSYLATASGMVPYVTAAAEWTTPVFLSGYISTGSIMGSLLQLINILIGIALYYPFIRIYEKKYSKDIHSNLLKLNQLLNEAESKGESTNFLTRTDSVGSIAKKLAADLEFAIKKQELLLYYQPQYNYQGICIGAEALLRWNHKTVGFINPALIIALSREAGTRKSLEKYILKMASQSLQQINQAYGDAYKLSVNITAELLEDPEFEHLLDENARKYKLIKHTLCLELTEQTALSNNENTIGKLDRIHKEGYKLAIDDFGMGYTSLLYLQNNLFDMVKLDGSLVKHILTNERSRDIISSIVYLSTSLKFMIIAEFVETKKQQEALLFIGCTHYQGFLYSKPIEFHQFSSLLAKQTFDGQPLS